MRVTLWTHLVLISSTLVCPSALADQFGAGANTFDIDFVRIDHLNNPDDTADGDGVNIGVQRFGSVSYKYWMGKYEISETMIGAANTLGGLGITTTAFGANKPAGRINWNEAARFVNWLNVSSGGRPAYKFDSAGNHQLWGPGDFGYNPSNVMRNSRATYFLPTDDEWYKTAYYNPEANNYYLYATSTNTPPASVGSGTAFGTAVYATRPADITLAGGLSPLGTMAQTGNITEWLESPFGSTPVAGGPRTLRGNNYSNTPTLNGNSNFRGFAADTNDSQYGGFRVIKLVPEPGSLLLLGCSLLYLPRLRWACG